MNGLPARDYLIEEYTTTVCPHCFDERPRRADEADVWKDGMLVSRDGKIWLRRFCARHGETESLYEEDAALWRARSGWSAPTLQVTPDRADNFAAFPDAYRDGLPASHGQHTCILLLNVTARCNYACVACYADAEPPGTPAPRDEQPTISAIRRTVETILARENGKLGVLMLSGGEPTVRDDLPQIIEALRDLPITRILLNTNGRRIARDAKFVEFLRAHRDRIEVYLQFDGVSQNAYQSLRDADVRDEKMRALELLRDAGLWTTLVMTLARGVNENEIGEVLQLGLSMPRCSGLMLQPLFGSGRNAGFDPRDRITPTGVLRRLGEQSGGVLGPDDFLPLPCSHRDCCDISYLMKTRDGSWKSLPALLGRDELKRWLAYFANTISFETASGAVKEMLKSGALARVFSEQMPPSAPALALDLAKLCGCVGGLADLLEVMKPRGASTLEKAAERTFRVTVKMFMDVHTLHAARIRQCCVHTGTFEDDPRRYSFCWRYLFADAGEFPRDNVIPLEAAPKNGASTRTVSPIENLPAEAAPSSR